MSSRGKFILIYVLEAFLYTAMLSRIKVVLSLSNWDWQCNWLLGNYKGNLKQCRGRGGRGGRGGKGWERWEGVVL